MFWWFRNFPWIATILHQGAQNNIMLRFIWPFGSPIRIDRTRTSLTLLTTSWGNLRLPFSSNLSIYQIEMHPSKFETYLIWLVVWNIFIFSIYFRGVGIPPTRYTFYQLQCPNLIKLEGSPNHRLLFFGFQNSWPAARWELQILEGERPEELVFRKSRSGQGIFHAPLGVSVFLFRGCWWCQTDRPSNVAIWNQICPCHL
jgi:hypothetical protein